MVDQMVNSGEIQINPEPLASGGGRSVRRRMDVVSRERQIVDGAIEFFAENGFGGQLRDLASSIGVTHTLLYHYFPTKQVLIDRVYQEVFEGRWKPDWETWIDDQSQPLEDRLTRFYSDYINNTLTKEFVRILVFSGLTDHTITDRFFVLLRERLIPRLIRETRRYRGVTSRARPTKRELELLMGLHGGFFYISMRRWIYGQGVHSEETPLAYDETFVRDRIKGYLQSSKSLFGK